MGAHFFPRAGYALILGAALVAPHGAYAFESTNNPVADALLAAFEAGGAETATIDEVATSGDQVVLHGLTVDYGANADDQRFTAESLAFSNASVSAEGSITAAALAITEARFVEDEDVAEFAAAALTDIRTPSPEEIKDPTKALGKKPAFRELEVTGISLQSEGEPAVPIERVACTYEPTNDDGSFKASFSAEKIALDPDAVDDDDFAERMKELGYDTALFDVSAAGSWSGEEGRARLDDFQISGREMGALHLSTTILGITPDFLTKVDSAKGDFGKLMELLQSLSVADLRLHFDNDTVVERVLDHQAKEAGTDRAGLVNQLSSALPGILSLLKNPDFEKKVAEAATTFLNEPKSLTASAHPAQAVPVAQLVGTAMIAPQSIPDILSVDVTANQ